MFTRKKAAMIVAEFLGTGVLTLVVLAVSKSTIGIPYFVALAAAVVVAGMTLAFGAVSGAHLNPAITIGLWSVRRVKTLPAIVYIAAQLLGGAAAYLLYTYFVGQHWPNAAGKFDNHILVAEAVGGLVFGLGWAATVYQKLSAGLSAALVGMSLMLAIVISSVAAGGIVNPAVALGLRTWVWGTFVLGPVLGAIIGFNLYALLFAPEGSLSLRRGGAKEAAVAETETVKTSSKPKKKK
jgi:glycerol uptake facilitator-like aquaporin